MPAFASRLFVRRFSRLAAVAAVLLGAAVGAAQQVTPDQAADMLLTSARTAYNDKNFAFAAARFREFLAKFGDHKDAPSARYGLALALLDGPDKDYNAAVDQLQPLAGAKDAPRLSVRPLLPRPGPARPGRQGPGPGRGQAAARRRSSRTRPAAASTRRPSSSPPPSAAFTARVKDADPDAKDLPIDLEWAARARCDLAEMQLRLLKTKEAREAVDAVHRRTSSSPRAAITAWASTTTASPASCSTTTSPPAGRSTQLAPFTDPVFGTHARYLLARVHHHDRANGARGDAASTRA